MLPLSIVRLFPRKLIEKYADRVRARLVRLESDVKAINLLLEGVYEVNGDTEGFISHLNRRLDERNTERYLLVNRLGEVENLLGRS